MAVTVKSEDGTTHTYETGVKFTTENGGFNVLDASDTVLGWHNAVRVSSIASDAATVVAPTAPALPTA